MSTRLYTRADSTTLSFRVGRELVKRLRAAARGDDRSVSAYTRRIVVRALDEQQQQTDATNITDPAVPS